MHGHTINTGKLRFIPSFLFLLFVFDALASLFISGCVFTARGQKVVLALADAGVVVQHPHAYALCSRVAFAPTSSLLEEEDLAPL